MPQLVDHQNSQTSRSLVRKFSWEESFESIQEAHMPILEPLKFQNRTWDAIEEHKCSENEFKIRRKPVNSDRTSRFSRSSGSLSSNSSINSDSSPPLSISSRSSSVSPPPPPKRAPPPTPPPTFPKKCSLQARSQCVSKNLPILPVDTNARPNQRSRSPSSSENTDTHDSNVPPKGRRISSGRRLPPPTYTNIPEQPPVQSKRFSFPGPRPQFGRKKSAGSESPKSPSGQYTAMLDLGRALRAPEPAARKPKTETVIPLQQTARPQKKSSIAGLSLPSPPWTKTVPTSPPPRNRHSTIGYRAVLSMSPQSPVSPVIQHRTRISFDPTYRGGYESEESSPHEIDNSASTPIYRPLKSPTLPKTNQPALARISTNFDEVMPLNIQHSPKPVDTRHIQKPKDVHFVYDEITHTNVQSEELTDILNVYLEEFVTDASSRGVMSHGLKDYLKSPTIMGEWDDSDSEDSECDVGLKEQGSMSVSMVRRALRD